MNANIPIIPETITVHLGAPSATAENVTLPFVDYIANVASSEIYPTWPEAALRANIYAQISFALNRIYTEYYRSRGYDFDITNSTAYDQYFVKGRSVFENIRELVSEMFDDYIRRSDSVAPLFSTYCDGIRVSCNGMSQWGSVALAEEGYTPYEILRYYYGDDIELVRNAPIAGRSQSAPETALRIGATGDDVRTVQIRLNRVGENYPSIPKIIRSDGIFSFDTENAVRAFQKAFNITVDGIVGKNTWYTLQNAYFAVRKLTELDAEGISLEEVTQQFPSVLRRGSTGLGVTSLQYYISYLSTYYDTIPAVATDGIFGPETEAAVRDMQTTFGLPADGIVGRLTWNAMYNAYLGIIGTVPVEYTEGLVVPFPGIILRVGAESDQVRLLQEYLNFIAQYEDSVPAVNPTGYFGSMTEASVLAVQRLLGLSPTGSVDISTWTAIKELYRDLYSTNRLGEGQYPGYVVGGS